MRTIRGVARIRLSLCPSPRLSSSLQSIAVCRRRYSRRPWKQNPGQLNYSGFKEGRCGVCVAPQIGLRFVLQPHYGTLIHHPASLLHFLEANHRVTSSRIGLTPRFRSCLVYIISPPLLIHYLTYSSLQIRPPAPNLSWPSPTCPIPTNSALSTS